MKSPPIAATESGWPTASAVGDTNRLVSPIDDRAVNSTLFAAVVVICALLSLRYGEDLWTHLKDWI
jgi:hypothetical protein